MGTKSHPDMGKESTEEREDPVVRDIVSALQGFANDTVLKVVPLPRQMSSKSAGRRLGEDTTEIHLTVDLYVSHFSFRRTVVSFATEDLLELTNLLWFSMQQETMEEQWVKLRKDNDRVMKLLQLMKK